MPAVPLVAASFIAGSVAGSLPGGPWRATLLVALLAAAASLLLRGPAATTQSGLLVLLAATAVAAAGHARASEAESRPLPPLATLEGTHEVVGVVRSDPRLSGTVARVDLRVEAVDGEPQSGGLRLTLPAPREPLRAGDRLTVTAEIERPPKLDDFDYAAFLRGRGIHAVAAFPQRWELLERNVGNDLTDGLRRVREWAVGNIERSLPEPEASVAAGMRRGRQRTLPAALEEDLRRTGTTHLLVVSGQNVALLLGTAVALLGAVLSRRRATLLVLLLLPGYVVLVGAEPPVVRAATMAVGIAIAAATDRRTPAWIYLLYAVALMLALRPLLVHDVAFQLSATATAGVLLVAPPLRDWAGARLALPQTGLGTALIEAGAVAFAAALAVLPVQTAHFETVSLVQVPANVIVAPLYEATVLIAAIAALLGWVGPIAGFVDALGVYAPATFLAVVGRLAALPVATVEVDAPLAAGAIWYAALATVVWLLSRRRPVVLAPAHRTGLAATVALGAAAAGTVARRLGAIRRPRERDRPRRRAGAGDPRPDGRGGAACAAPRLRRPQPRRSVLTHADTDHAGALPEVRRRMRVGEVLTRRRPPAGPADRHRRPHPPERSDGDRGALAAAGDRRASAPQRQQPRARAALADSASCGSCSPPTSKRPEQWLVDSGLDLRADVLVLPHHGSRTSSIELFLDAVQPAVAVASVGASNQHGHPHPEVVERYGNALLYRTDEHGDVTLRSDGERLWVGSAR